MYRASCTVYYPDKQMYNICFESVGLDNINVQNVAILYNAIYHAKHPHITEPQK
jgi:hypothetical protein